MQKSDITKTVIQFNSYTRIVMIFGPLIYMLVARDLEPDMFVRICQAAMAEVLFAALVTRSFVPLALAMGIASYRWVMAQPVNTDFEKLSLELVDIAMHFGAPLFLAAGAILIMIGKVPALKDLICATRAESRSQ